MFSYSLSGLLINGKTERDRDSEHREDNVAALFSPAKLHHHILYVIGRAENRRERVAYTKCAVSQCERHILYAIHIFSYVYDPRHQHESRPPSR